MSTNAVPSIRPTRAYSRWVSGSVQPQRSLSMIPRAGAEVLVGEEREQVDVLAAEGVDVPRLAPPLAGGDGRQAGFVVHHPRSALPAASGTACSRTPRRRRTRTAGRRRRPRSPVSASAAPKNRRSRSSADPGSAPGSRCRPRRAGRPARCRNHWRADGAPTSRSGPAILRLLPAPSGPCSAVGDWPGRPPASRRRRAGSAGPGRAGAARWSARRPRARRPPAPARNPARAPSCRCW